MRIVGQPKEFCFHSKNVPVEVSHIARQRLQELKAWQRLRAVGFPAGKAAEYLSKHHQGLVALGKLSHMC